MSNIFSKLRDFVGLNEPGEYDDDYDDTETVEAYPTEYQQEPAQHRLDEEHSHRQRPRRERTVVTSETEMGQPMNNVVGIRGAATGVSEVVVMEPRSFEEMPQAIQALRERKTVVLNLTIMDPDQAQRAVDFVAGGTYAIDGHQERIGESIFLFTPNCVQVSTQSGVVHEIPQTPTRTSRPAAPAPAGWAQEQAWVAQ